MENYQMRSLVRGAYSTDSWHQKVDKMHDNQIVALYLSLVRRGKIRG